MIDRENLRNITGEVVVRFLTWMGSPDWAERGSERFGLNPEKKIQAIASAHSNAAKRAASLSWLTGGTRVRVVREHERACFNALRELAELRATQASKP